MLTNPIRGKAGRQICVPNGSATGVVLYTVPAGKYLELNYIPTGIIVTSNGISAPSITANIAAPAIFQAGTVITSSGANTGGFFGTEYDA